MKPGLRTNDRDRICQSSVILEKPMPVRPDITLAARGLTKIYRGQSEAVRAVEDVSLELHAGEVVALMGPSGTGKTTLLSMLGCILTPDRGQLHICGEQVRWHEAALPYYRRRFFGYVAQRSTLLSALNVSENVAVPLKIAGKSGPEVSEVVKRCLQVVNLEHRASYPVNVLSGGEKQRVAIARALASAAPILLTDEPTASLDSKSGSQIITTLRSLAVDHGKSVLIVTHDERLLPFTDRVFHMDDGRLQVVSSQASEWRVQL